MTNKKLSLNIELSKEESLIVNMKIKNNSNQDIYFSTPTSKIFNLIIKNKNEEILWEYNPITTLAVKSWNIPANEKLIKTIEIPTPKIARKNVYENDIFNKEDKEDLEKLIRERSINFEEVKKIKIDVSINSKNIELNEELNISVNNIKTKDLEEENIRKYIK